MSSSLPQSQLITSTSPSKLTEESTIIKSDKTNSSISSDKTNPKMIKQRSLSSKTIYRSNSGITTNLSSEKIDSADLNPNSTARMFSHSLFLQTLKYSLIGSNIQNNNNYVLKPKSLEDDESDLQRKFIVLTQ